MARHRQLMALRQQGCEIGGFAQLFWSLTLGLGYNDETLKDFLNICLDDSLSQWEMEETQDPGLLGLRKVSPSSKLLGNTRSV